MADNNYIVTITFKADPGNVGQQAAAAGKQASDAFAKAFDPNIADIFQKGAFQTGNIATAGKQAADQFTKAFESIPAEIAKQLSGVGVSYAQFARNVPSQPLPSPPSPASAEAAAKSLEKRIEPVVAGIEAFSMLLKGAPFGAVLTQIGKAIPDVGAGAGGRLGAGAVGAGVGSLFGAGTGGAIGGFLGAGSPVGIAAGIAAQKIAESLSEFLDFKKLGDIGAERVVGLSETAASMKGTVGDLLETQAGAAAAGVDFENLTGILNRLAITAQRSLPRIAKEERDSANVIEESNIKVRESHRAVEKAQDDRAASVDRLTKTSGQLIKFDATRAEEREQQARAAELAVSGAQLGVVGAGMRATQAAINLRAAPEQARIADIQGPLTVEGARLGAQGARLGLEEARARYYGYDLGEDFQERKRLHALQVARNNAEEADVRERQAQLAERTRREEKAAGVGPVAQAEFRAAEAEHAQQQAALAQDRAKTAQTGLGIEQQINSLGMERAEIIRSINQSLRDVLSSHEKTREIEEDRAQQGRKQLQYQLPELIGRGIRGEIPDYDFTKVEGAGLRDYFIGRTGGKIIGPGGILEQLGGYLRDQLGGEHGDALRQEGVIRDLLPGARGFGGMAGFQAMRRLLLQTPEERERELDRNIPGPGGGPGTTLRQQLTALQERVGQVEPGARALQSQEALEKFNGSLQRLSGEIDSIKLGGKVSAFSAEIESGGVGIKNALIGVANSLNEPSKLIDEAGRNFATNINKINNFLSGLVAPSGKSGKSPSGAPPAEFNEEAVGGLLHGLGTGTSDQIPIMASPGEYVIKAETASRLGEPFLNSLNAGHFAEGGTVGDDSGMGKWAAIIKSSQWGIWAAKMGLPALGVTLPAAADVVLSRANPLISVGLALKAIWDDTHSHPPETLGEVLREQRGGLSVNELMAKHFAETRQATFDERFPSPDKDSIPANFDERFGKAEGDTFAQRFFFGDASGMQEGGTISTKELREELRRRREEYTPQKYTPQSYTPERYTPASYSPQGDASGGGGGGGGGGSGTVAHGPAPDATIIRNPFVSSDTVSYQERVLMEHDGFDPDNPNDVKLWRQYIGSRLPPNMGMPGGPTGAGVIARGQIARGPAPPILMVKPGAGKDYTIPTPAGGADVRYNPYAGKYWPEGSGKPYDENDQTTFGKPGVTFDPMNSSTWSEGYRNDFYTAPGYTDIKTSDVDLATPIHFGRRSDNDEDKATGGLIRRYFGGGPVGMQAGGFPPAPDMGGAITREALSDLSGRLGHIPTSGAALTPSASAFSGLNTLGVHQLDLRTNAGNFPAAVSEETWAAIQRTSLMNQVSSAGSRPSWYS